jgi:hypothetical protein
VREVYDWREIASATEAVYYDTVAKIPRTRAVRKRRVRRTLVGTG